MPLLSQQNAVCPIGGSHFAHSFQKRKAYEGYVYSTRPREIVPKARHKEEYQLEDKPPSPRRWKALTGDLPQTKTYYEAENVKSGLQWWQTKKLTRAMSQPMLKFEWTDHFKNNYPPDFIVPGNNKRSYKAQWLYKTPEDMKPKPDIKSMPVKPIWYPRENLEMSLPAAQLRGIDPQFYNNPLPFEMKNDYGPHPPVPIKPPRETKKWESQAGWEDPSLRHCHKITQKWVPPEQRSNNLPPL